MVAIDSLNGYAYAMPEERLLELHLHELVSYLNQQSVISLLVMTEHGLLTPQPRSFDVSYIADTVILLRPFEFRGVVRKAIAVHKRRAGAHERTIREFDLSQGKLTVGQPLEQFSGIITGNLQYVGNAMNPPESER
jgi:circadian clock protein KaiC